MDFLQPLNPLDATKVNPFLRAKVVTLFERSYRLATSASQRGARVSRRPRFFSLTPDSTDFASFSHPHF